MSSPPKVDHVRDTFRKEVSKAEALTQSVLALPQQVHPNAPQGIHPKHARQVVALAFMGMISAWEEFLERTLVRYIAGAITTGGYRPALKVGQASSIEHAYQVISQKSNYDPEKDYLKVSDPGWVLSTCEFFFRVHPYGCIRNNADLIKKANLIRNRVAHHSTKCKTDFKTVALHFMQFQNGKLPQSYGPGNLLLEQATRHFGQQAQNGNYFTACARRFEWMANQIVP